MPVSLPIDAVLPQLIAALHNNPSVVLRAPAGAGKTTRVPAAMDNAGFAASGQIVMLEPRRIAARAAARRIAAERNERPGQSAGFRVRFEEAVSRETRILVVTEGVLLRRLQDDPFLEGISAVIFDEFHERRLESDLALAMTRRVQQTVRPELRIVAMSATMDPGPIAAFLGNCPVVESEGRLHPVQIEYLRTPERVPLTTQAALGVQRVLERSSGDVLVFLPGVGEILRTQQELEPLARRHNLSVMPLYGDLSAEEQDRVLVPGDRRKVVLSTNVAETSVTIEGITIVVDTGCARQMRFDPDVGLDRLDLISISRAAADQRAGRAGRTQPGYCLRLWEESTQRIRPEFDTPELHRVDLSAALLRLHAWGESNVNEFPWFEHPSQQSVDHAERLLKLLGAIDDQGVTEMGRMLVTLPVAPRIARLLVEGQQGGFGARCATLAALLSERNPFSTRSDDRQAAGTKSSMITVTSHHSRSDVLDRLTAFERYLTTRQTETPFGTIIVGAARTIQQVASQITRSLADIRQIGSRQTSDRQTSDRQAQPASDAGSDEVILRALVTAFPDRVAKRRESERDRGIMTGGRGVRLAPRSAVMECPLFLCVEIDDRGTDALVRQASEVQREWLPSAMIRTADELFFHPTQKQVVARRRTWFDDLLLDETPAAISSMSDAADVLFTAACSQWSSVFPADDEAVTGFITRVRCLATWMPELSLPSFDEVHRRQILRELCEGRRSFAELRQAPWLSAMQSGLSYSELQIIEREAPEKLTVPGGKRIRLQYEEGRPPVLPVRIQDAFGWKQTPTLAGGRIRVLLHLLAPNMRPQQITDDLASFWTNTYSQVRKDLKRRYPKHAWPEDPWSVCNEKHGP